MAKIDPEQERRRLSEFYAGQLDGELEKVAAQAYELTEIARELLRAELAKRNLPINLVEQAPVIVQEPREPKPGDPPPPAPKEEVLPEDGELELRDMVIVRQFRDLPAALLAKATLDSAEIYCALVDDNMVRLDWFYSNAIGGIKLLVEAEDATEAEQVLAQPIPEHFDVSGIGEYQQPRCPKCGSLDVNYRNLQAATYLTLALNVPIPLHRRAWHCRACGIEWEEVPDQSASTV